jgi:hypothetical protein
MPLLHLECTIRALLDLEITIFPQLMEDFQRSQRSLWLGEEETVMKEVLVKDITVEVLNRKFLIINLMDQDVTLMLLIKMEDFAISNQYNTSK